MAATEVTQRARRDELDREDEETTKRWKRGEYAPDAAVVFLGWLSPEVFGPGKTVASNPLLHPVDPREGGLEDVRVLYGDYDGGGITAMAMKAGIIASASRDGIVRLTRRAEESDVLEERAVLPVGSIVSSVLLLDGGSVVTGTLDGKVRRWDLVADDDGDSAVVVKYEVGLELDLSAPVLCAAVDPDRRIIVAGTGWVEGAAGTAYVFNLEDGELLHRWTPHMSTRSVVIGHGQIVTGGIDGSLRALSLNSEGSGADAFTFSADTEAAHLEPWHSGPVVALAMREAGLLLSGALDGTIRVWDLEAEEDEDGVGGTGKALYALRGYKVWLGSVLTDGRRLLSDGCDDGVLMHDFSRHKEGS
eukprot:gene1090-1644_t